MAGGKRRINDRTHDEQKDEPVDEAVSAFPGRGVGPEAKRFTSPFESVLCIRTEGRWPSVPLML